MCWESIVKLEEDNSIEIEKSTFLSNLELRQEKSVAES